MNNLFKWISIVTLFIILITGSSSLSSFQVQDHLVNGGKLSGSYGSVYETGVGNTVSTQPLIPILKFTQIKFILIQTNSNITPSGKIYIDGELSMNITSSNLSDLHFKVAENRFYKFELQFNSGTYLPYYLNTTVEGNTSVPVILQSVRNSASNLYVLGFELNNEYISFIVAFLILMLSLVAIPRKYLGRN